MASSQILLQTSQRSCNSLYTLNPPFNQADGQWKACKCLNAPSQKHPSIPENDRWKVCKRLNGLLPRIIHRNKQTVFGQLVNIANDFPTESFNQMSQSIALQIKKDSKLGAILDTQHTARSPCPVVMTSIACSTEGFLTNSSIHMSSKAAQLTKGGCSGMFTTRVGIFLAASWPMVTRASCQIRRHLVAKLYSQCCVTTGVLMRVCTMRMRVCTMRVEE